VSGEGGEGLLVSGEAAAVEVNAGEATLPRNVWFTGRVSGTSISC